MHIGIIRRPFTCKLALCSAACILRGVPVLLQVCLSMRAELKNPLIPFFLPGRIILGILLWPLIESSDSD